jgi:ribosomal protein L12E/L44/L45/RPP1/RPP2
MTTIARAPVAAPEFSDEEEESEEEESEEDSWMGGVRFDTGAPAPEAAPVPS